VVPLNFIELQALKRAVAFSTNFGRGKLSDRWNIIESALLGGDRSLLTRLTALDAAAEAAATEILLALSKMLPLEDDSHPLAIFLNILFPAMEPDDQERTKSFLLKHKLTPLAGDVPNLSDADTRIVGSREQVLREGIVDVNTLRDILILDIALRASKAVVRVKTGAVVGTGFLIAPQLVMTNHHIIRDAADAGSAIVDFNYRMELNGKTSSKHHILPAKKDGVFVTSAALDYTVFELAQPAKAEPLRLTPRVPKPKDAIPIIQHPGGGLMQISFQQNFVIFANEHELQYTTSTLGGSSGSPLFDDSSYDVIGIHHSYNKTHQVNQGTSVAAILKDLKAQNSSLPV
jgi:V8-like Glu-specific endopeptidase